MKLTSLRLCAGLLLASAGSAQLAAQNTLSYLPGTNSLNILFGQSFTPDDAGVFPTDSAFLTSMSFVVGVPQLYSTYAATPTFIDIYSDPALTAFVGSSSTSQTWTGANGEMWAAQGTQLTWGFDSLELDKDSVYYALFSTDAGAGAWASRAALYTNGNPYAGGLLIWGSTTPNQIEAIDAAFSATFATSASSIPEPSTYALGFGVVTLATVLIRRRKTTKAGAV